MRNREVKSKMVCIRGVTGALRVLEEVTVLLVSLYRPGNSSGCSVTLGNPARPSSVPARPLVTCELH